MPVHPGFSPPNAWRMSGGSQAGTKHPLRLLANAVMGATAVFTHIAGLLAGYSWRCQPRLLRALVAGWLRPP